MSFSYSLKQIASFIDAEVVGDDSTVITGLATLKSATANDIAFLSNPKYAKQIDDCQAGAVILQSAQAQFFNGNCLIVSDAYLSYAKISAWFDKAPVVEKTIHASASIDPTATVGDAVSIGPNVVIEADGFGFAPNGKAGWQKISQIGGVVIGDNVEIGACTTIDRGAINDTIIGNNVILDNHVQIAHNAVIGDNTAMAAYAGVAGSTVVGKNCVLAAGAHVVGHASLCDNVQVMAHSLVFKDIKQPNSYSNATMPLMTTAEWSKNSVRMGQLNLIAQRLKKLEAKD